MIVVDSSAIVAILFDEPSAGALVSRLATETERVISVASYLEVGTVLAGRRRAERLLAMDDLDAFLDAAGIELAPVDAEQARLALRARIVYGRGMGKAPRSTSAMRSLTPWQSRSTHRCSLSATTLPRPI
jgi:ribonuclease VapC